MGAALRRTAISPNIKERRDYSCALFDRHRRVIAMGDHMPVHLGSMPLSVAAVVERYRSSHPGDIAILNDPVRRRHPPPRHHARSPHLHWRIRRCAVLLRRHPRSPRRCRRNMFAGSMGPAREIYQEGIRIPPVQASFSGGRRQRRNPLADPAQRPHPRRAPRATSTPRSAPAA